MSSHFGPWTTAIDTGSTAQLSAFWKRRLTLLRTMNRRSTRVSRRCRVVIAALALTALALPSLRFPESVAAAPGAKQDTPNKNATPVAGDGQPVRVTLPGGAIVELLGVGEHPSDGSPWWAPDGVPTAAPYRRLRAKVTTDATEIVREIAIRWVQKPADDVTTSWSVAEAGSTAGGAPFDVDGKQVEHVETHAVAFPAAKKTCLVRISVATAAWETLAETDGRGERSMGKDKIGFAFTSAYEHEGATTITIAHNVGGRDVRTVAVDNDGKTIVSGPASIVGAQGFMQTTARFAGLRLKDIKEFRVQSRIFQVIEIQNVSLQPGQQTKPKVVTLQQKADAHSSNQVPATTDLMTGALITWESLGLALAAAAPEQFHAQHTKYRGGLEVKTVTADGPAAGAGIRSGDVLVGLYIYETVKKGDVDYALARAEHDRLQALKFYVLRGGETLSGNLKTARRWTADADRAR